MPKKTNKKKPEEKTIEFSTNLSAPPIFIDHLIYNGRSDGHVLLRLGAELPEGIVEQAKVVVTQDFLKKVIDLVCQNSGYYPVKPKKSSKK